jgi:hypothetical protein
MEEILLWLLAGTSEMLYWSGQHVWTDCSLTLCLLLWRPARLILLATWRHTVGPWFTMVWCTPISTSAIFGNVSFVFPTFSLTMRHSCCRDILSLLQMRNFKMWLNDWHRNSSNKNKKRLSTETHKLRETVAGIDRYLQRLGDWDPDWEQRSC